MDESLSAKVAQIIADVKENGDQAIINICNQFDKANFNDAADLLVNEEDIKQAVQRVNPDLLAALKLAYQRIYEYHSKQLPQDFEYEDDLGNKLGNRWQAIESMAVYVPGGTALYPSSVLMGAVPAIVAKVKNIVLTVPSFAGKIDDAVLAAAQICGIKTIYKMGGSAAIAALALGTKTVKKVDKIVGPGNSFVALAKKQLFGQVGIDMIAGPTDILVIADKNNNPDWIAADLLSQLEHGVDSKAILITDDAAFANLVNEEINKLSQTLSRQNIIKQSLLNSAIIIVDNLVNDAPAISNKVAPEHLEIIANDEQEISQKITNAGAIFLGKYSPEAMGDYIAGPNHTLPTMGTARFSSGLSIFDFLKRMSVISCSKEGFESLSKSTALLAQSEGFEAHKLSVTIRNEK
ncbi:MAG: histidinol dehydrogenase [Proteobacteria bacterium]|nr:histidinol dehydrogenase [Pseudomonadota bacterium]